MDGNLILSRKKRERVNLYFYGERGPEYLGSVEVARLGATKAGLAFVFDERVKIVRDEIDPLKPREDAA